MIKTSKLYKPLKLFAFGLLTAGSIFFMNTTASCAQSNAGCAVDTWRAMANQGVLQARRENIMNQRYIVKADSVLQYSCFRDERILANTQIGKIFSNGDLWADRDVPLMLGERTHIGIYNGDPTLLHTGSGHDGIIVTPGGGHDYQGGYVMPLLSPTSLDLSLIKVVGETAGFPMANYIDGQFKHQVLSGTTSLNSPEIALCHNMSEVWKAAKCKNFDGTAVFYSFEELAGVTNIANVEPRIFPPNMPCQ